ncbi:glycine cleavage system protein H [Methylovirgula ligni]|uniref:Glycine cleavage system H protein n=1 Tax=Methylovirgula ligni TaxID=569860 RepID=A0A3D9YPM7_9HYPH|nr:glycine cleavage system protein GcvH [Methylovirgula ligni]QAY95011.1 glycine cleavage system protein H [Methylovirgula ligni]REF84527.1 glycine cleavage system H protein [Methylovirgula ligni]
MLKFTGAHEWLKLDGDVAVVGITRHAAGQIGDLVFVELPKIGAALKTGERAVVLESIKATAEIRAPVAGEVIEINEDVVAHPPHIAADPQGEGWLYRLRVDDVAAVNALMDEAAYRHFLGAAA